MMLNVSTYSADVAVVGGGIVGLAFAWEAARRGRKVALFERDVAAQGASIRNFGMIWPIGQPAGFWHTIAMRSRERWLELNREARIWVEPCGSLHLACQDDESAVLHEYLASHPHSGRTFLGVSDVQRRFPAVNTESLQGAMYSDTESCVDPRQAIAAIPKYLQQTYGVIYRSGTLVFDMSMPHIRTASGETWKVDQVIVCGGADFATLFPREWSMSGLRRCKLQMMRTVPQPHNWRIGSHIAGGLTLCHYAAFRDCPSLLAVKGRIEQQYPEYVRYGIHVMASHNQLGEIVIGDSHEYDSDITPFDKSRIDELILNYLHGMIRIPDTTIASRWHGVYIKHPTEVVYQTSPQPGCHIIASPGGAGMTLSFGYAEHWWNEYESGANRVQSSVVMNHGTI